MILVDTAAADWKSALRDRVRKADDDISTVVREIIEDVRGRGDDALLDNARRFDSALVESILVPIEELDDVDAPAHLSSALDAAFARISAFHKNQIDKFTGGLKAETVGWSWKMPNEAVGQRIRPLQSAGLYVPGGLANYPSSILMLAGPATAAGVSHLAVATPSGPDGKLSPAIRAALRVAGIRTAYRIGGAAAVAALAFGTESVARVDKIVGPGNRFVNEAKRQLWGSVGVDGLYGPSEVCVLIDESANPVFAAADLLAQIEHAPDNLGFVVALNRDVWVDMAKAIEVQVLKEPRKEILQQSLANVLVFLVDDEAVAAAIVNEIAPEHLSLAVKDSGPLLDKIHNASCVLIGDWTPESASDYCIGPSHTLPTGAAARFAGPVQALDFLKIQSVAQLEREDLAGLLETVAILSEFEGFPAHATATAVRFTGPTD